MWKRKISRQFRLVIHPSISLEEAQECLKDHDLMAHLFYANERITKLDAEGTPNATSYKVGASGNSIRVMFEQQPRRQVCSHERLDFGISSLIRWQVMPRSEMDDDDVDTSTLLMEEVELQIPRLLSLIFPINVGRAVSVKTQLLAVAMEIRHRNPGIRLDDLVREARNRVVGFDLMK